MFKHGMTGKVYYSVREKINYYINILKGKIPASTELKNKAKRRLPELQGINLQSYNEPTMIVTDDKLFGNRMSKPRACVVVGVDKKNRLLACPVRDRTTKTVILENDTSRQVEGTPKLLDRSDVYETKYMLGLAVLTGGDKKRLEAIHCKK